MKVSKNDFLKIKQEAEKLMDLPGGILNIDTRLGEGVADEIYSGIIEFNRGMDSIDNDASEWIKDNINNMVMGKQKKEKINAYINMIYFMSELIGEKNTEAFKEIQEQLKKCDENSECLNKIESDLFDQLCDLIDKTASVIFASADREEILRECVNENNEEFIAFAAKSMDAKIYTIAATYSLYKNGELESIEYDSENEIKPKDMAILMAAEIERDSAEKEAAGGRISDDELKNRIKKIAKVAVTLLFGAAIATFLVSSIAKAASVLITLVGTGIAGSLLLGFLGVIKGEDIIRYSKSGFERIKTISEKAADISVEGLIKVYKSVSSYIKEKVIPQAKIIIKDIAEKAGEVLTELTREVINMAGEYAINAGKEFVKSKLIILHDSCK